MTDTTWDREQIRTELAKAGIDATDKEIDLAIFYAEHPDLA